MKIFVSYSRRDAGDFANQIHKHLSSFNYDIFTDVDDIKAGDIWSNTITTNISSCDIFVVIVTDGALQSSYIENEILQAQREKKTIIPCFHRTIVNNEIKWGLSRIQGVEFDDRYELARNLYSKIGIENYDPSNKIGDYDKMTVSKEQIIISDSKPKTFYGEKRIFIGRQAYIDKIKEYFANSNDPIAVIGLGGIGKSTLVFKAIHQCEEIFDSIIPLYFSIIGVSFDSFLFSIAKNLNLSAHEFENLTLEEKEQILIDGLVESKNHPLLFLDNYETISGILKRSNIDEFSERQYENAVQINNLLNRLPSNITIILTSRLRKNLDVEKELILDGLSIEDGTHLFTKLVGTDFEEDTENIKAVHEIVNKTGGHPLSIEIFTKSYQGLGLDELHGMIKHLGLGIVNPTLEKRLVTLEATFDYSLNSLDDNLKQLLPKFTIFNSPFPISAAVDVFNAKKEYVIHLYNRSLLTRIESDEYGRIPRQEFWLYDFHPVIRKYLEKIVMKKYSKLEEEYGEKYRFYYSKFIDEVYDAVNQETSDLCLRRFYVMAKTENNDFKRSIDIGIKLGYDISKIFRRLENISNYINVSQLNNLNFDPNLSNKINIDLFKLPNDYNAGDQISDVESINSQEKIRIFEIGDKVALRIQNNSNEIINIVVIDLQPDWGTTKLYPEGSTENFITMTQHSELFFPLQVNLPSDYNEGKDIIKIFIIGNNFKIDEHPLVKLISYLSTNKPINRDIVENLRSSKEWMASQLEVKIIRK